MFDLGAGPAPLPRTKLTVDFSGWRPRQAVSDAGMIEKAARLGDAIRKENGVANAVR